MGLRNTLHRQADNGSRPLTTDQRGVNFQVEPERGEATVCDQDAKWNELMEEDSEALRDFQAWVEGTPGRWVNGKWEATKNA
jgi:hypothetical protein